MTNLPIGIFDSGVGGLTVMRAVADALPRESLTYLGDTARVPYGNRSAQTIRRYAVNAAALLWEEGVKALVIACNTASAHGLVALRERYDMPILGVIEPVARRAAATTQTGVVGVIGTRGTITSGSYLSALNALGVDHVVQQACPLFVPLAEEGWTEGGVVRDVARAYLETFRGTEVDTLILGCTHYPLLAPTIAAMIEEMVDHPVAVLDSAAATAAALVQTLDDHTMRTTSDQRSLDFWATDDPAQFRDTAGQFFGAALTHVAHVDIQDVATQDSP